MEKKLALKIFEGFSIQRWNDLIRPFDLVEMDKAGEKMVLAYIIGKYEEHNGNFIDWKWLIYASLFDLLRKISLCDIKAPVQQMLRRQFPNEYMHLNEWVLNQYKKIMPDEELFSEFTIYVGQHAGYFDIPQELKTTMEVYKAAHKFSTMRELEMLAVVNEKERLKNIRIELEAEIQPFLHLEGLQKLVTHQKAFDFILKIEQLRFQTRWNQTPRVPATSVLGHCFYVAIMTLLLGRESNPDMCNRRIINNFFSALFHDLPESVTRDIISPVKTATDDLPNIVKKIEDEIVNRELVPLMEPFFVDEVIYYTSDEFTNRILDKKGHIKHVSWEELNSKYNSNEFQPIDGRLVRICDHFSALMEADISIKHGITSAHLTGGRNATLNRYKSDEIISGINVYEFFHQIVTD
ncbi:MAG: HD domain-containing protein [Treponema sp.]|nr:HD domain-containing protein [Treponema sp.]